MSKKEMVWPGAQAREGRKQVDASWTEAVRELGSKKLHKVATKLYQLEILKGEVSNESPMVGPRALNGILAASGKGLEHTLKPTLIFHL